MRTFSIDSISIDELQDQYYEFDESPSYVEDNPYLYYIEMSEERYLEDNYREGSSVVAEYLCVKAQIFLIYLGLSLHYLKDRPFPFLGDLTKKG